MSDTNHSEMKAKLKEYIDTIFADTPHGARVNELREEMVQNLYEKYDDLIAEGRTPAAAYHMSISGVGDVSELLSELAAEQTPVDLTVSESPSDTRSTGGATAVASSPDASASTASGTTTPHTSRTASHTSAFTRISDEEQEAIRKYRRMDAIMSSIAIALYICCVTPMILLSDTTLEDSLGLFLMFSMIAVATAMLIFVNRVKPSIMEEKKWYLRLDPTSPEEARRMINAYRSRSSVLTSVAVALYILSWLPSALLSQFGGLSLLGPVLLFLFVAIATGLLIYNDHTKPDVLRYKGLIAEDNTLSEHERSEDSPYDARDRRQEFMRKPRSKVYHAISALLWVLTALVYLAISFTTSGWAYTWLIFLIAMALDNIIQAIFDLCR